jgi:hypothetical protein
MTGKDRPGHRGFAREGPLRRAARLFGASIILGGLTYLNLTEQDSFFPSWLLILGIAIAVLYFLMAAVQFVAWLVEKSRT